jgi:hypothetical protein
LRYRFEFLDRRTRSLAIRPNSVLKAIIEMMVDERLLRGLDCCLDGL